MPGNAATRADIRVMDAWARTMGNTNQKIADIEDGDGGTPNYFHEDLLNRITVHNSLYTGEHSTNVVGLMAANHNNLGIAGVNKYAHINSYVYTTIEEWGHRVQEADMDGNQIINISQGSVSPVDNVGSYLAKAYNNNKINVVSAGNNGNSIHYPAVYTSTNGYDSILRYLNFHSNQ